QEGTRGRSAVDADPGKLRACVCRNDAIRDIDTPNPLTTRNEKVAVGVDLYVKRTVQKREGGWSIVAAAIRVGRSSCDGIDNPSNEVHSPDSTVIQVCEIEKLSAVIHRQAERRIHKSIDRQVPIAGEA